MIEAAALTVSQVNLHIKQLLSCDDILTDISVKGELSNFKAHSSGHMYMSLKDESGVIRAVMFRSSAAGLTFKPANGVKVIAHGRVNVYERDGQYQLYIDHMIPDGIGDLHVAFEQLKVKLSAEGLFDAAHKKPLPKYPKTIGVVTAPTGAAIRDILNILSRRFAYSDVLLYPVLVQGESAAASISEAIKYFNDKKSADVLIVGRGGGSIEDLWAFNEEIVARAIYESKIPVISAVGHEIDFTIADFVADMRAPTPSAAAELVVPSQTELKEKFNNVYKRLYSCAHRIIENNKLRVKMYAEKTVLVSPMYAITDRQQYFDRLSERFENSCKNIAGEKKQELGVLASKLDALSPLGSLNRGFSVVKSGQNIIKSVKDVSIGDSINIVVTDGEFSAEVREVN